MAKFLLAVMMVLMALGALGLIVFLNADLEFRISPGSIEGWSLDDGCLTTFEDADGSDKPGQGRVRISQYGFCGGER